MGEPLPDNRTQTFRGSKWVHLRRDLQACARLWARGEITLPETLRSWRGRKAHALFSIRDPVPFIADLGRAAANFLRRLGQLKEAARAADS